MTVGQSQTPEGLDSAAIRELFGVRFLRLRDPMVRRFAQLIPGLLLFGVGGALSIEADLGASPWTVFHQGAADRLGITIGTMVIATGLIVLLFFIPLREPMGVGTLLNVLIIGPVIDIALAVIPDLDSMLARVAAIAIAPVFIGLASGLYIGAGFGPGPRDGLMTAMGARGLKISTARTLVEITALGAGWLLGGTVGLGTVYIGLTLGFWVRLFLNRLRIDPVAAT